MKLRRILCKLGIHNWSRWLFTRYVYGTYVYHKYCSRCPQCRPLCLDRPLQDGEEFKNNTHLQNDYWGKP